MLAADPPPSVTACLEYDVPAQGCPPASVLRVEFARRLGYDFVVEDAPLRVVVKIAREKGALASSLTLYDSAGKQLWTKPAIFPAWQCLTLVQLMAGLLAVRFDPLVFRAAAVVAPPPPPPLPPPLPLPPPPLPKPESAPAPPPRPVTVSLPVRPKRGFRLLGGLDGVFTSFIAPSASAGFGLWAGVDLVDRALSFELDLRSTWSFVPAEVPLPYQPHAAVRSSYISGVLAGCWRRFFCPLLEIGSMKFSTAGAPAATPWNRRSAVVAAGARFMHEQRLSERVSVRGLFELEVIAKTAAMGSEALPGGEDRPALSPGRFSFSAGLGFGGSL